MSTLAPAAAVAAYLRDFSDSIALLPGARRVDFGHVRGVLTGRAMFNRFYDAVHPSRVTVEDVATIAAATREQVRTAWLLDEARVADLAPALEAHGFRSFATWSGMWRGTDGVPSAPLPAGVTVATIDDVEALRTWSRVCAGVEGFSRAQEETFFDLFATLRAHAAPWTHLLATINGREVATASLFVTGRIAAVDWVNTIPDARGRGIAGALVTRLLRDARGTYDLAVLTSTAAGESVYRRLGFARCSGVVVYWRGGGGE